MKTAVNKIISAVLALSILLCFPLSSQASSSYYNAETDEFFSSYSYGVNVTETKDGARLEWYGYDSDYEFDGFRIYRSKNGSDFKKLATVKYTKYKESYGSRLYSYKDKTATSYANYRYVVVSYAVIDGKTYVLKDFDNYTEFVRSLPNATLTSRHKSSVIKWKKIKNAVKYKVYMSVDYGEEVKLKTVKSKTSCNVKDINNLKHEYVYSVKAYNKNGKLIAAAYNISNNDGTAFFRAANKKKKNKNTVPVVSVREKKNSKAWSVTLTKKDREILDKFAAKHFKDGWTKAEKAQYTLDWINKKVEYAYGDKYNKIAEKSYVEAIFKKKLGQCLQYNGAYAMFLTYLGYDARIIQGWRGQSMDNHWSHYWCEIKVDDMWLLMETGNEQDSGSWSYFCAPYSRTSGYLINQKPAEEKK